MKTQTQSTIVYEPIDLNLVKTLGKKRFNSNNHHTNDVKPDDYFTQIEECNTKNWVNKLNRPHKKIIIDNKNDILFLHKISHLGKITRKTSNLYKEDLLDFVKSYETKYANIFENNQKYFVRSEHVSLKYGEHGLIPYTNFKQIIESICTCPSGHTPLNFNDTQITLYLFEWIEMNKKDEFRVFVKNKKITCISQQYLYDDFGLNEEVLRDKIIILMIYFENHVKNMINLCNFSYDFTFVYDEPYVIEFNTFGKEYASGSALFHWILDHDKLYGSQENLVYVRYIETQKTI